MDRTVKVTNFTWRPAIRKQLYDCFYGVAQVEKVCLSKDKNAAYVQLYDESSLQYVVEQDWELRGDRLNVRPAIPTQRSQTSAPPISNKKNHIAIADEQSLRRGACLAQYAEGNSKFWSDVPHHSFTIAPKAKKRKRNTSCLIGGGISRHENKKRPQRRNKKKKKKSCAYLEPAVSISFGRSCIADIVREDTAVSAKSFKFGVCSTQRICTQDQQLQPEAAAQIHGKDQLEESSRSHGLPREESATKMKNNHHQLEGPLTQDRQLIPSGSSVIQVYVKGETTSVLSLCSPATATEVQERTADLLHVPAELLHITHEGHSLTDKAASRLRQGSNLHCTIKGKGGMEQSGRSKSQDGTEAAEARKQKALRLKEKGSEPKDMHAEITRAEDQVGQKKKRKRRKKKAKSVQPDANTECAEDDQEGAGADEQVTLETNAEEVTIDTSDQPMARASNDSLAFDPASVETGCQAVLPNSSEKDVKSWLRGICRLDEKDLNMFKGIDGSVLFQYKEAKKLMRHTKISLGKARKIFFFRDKPYTQSKIAEWCVAEVVEFAEKVAGNREDVLCFEEHQIDGPAFLSYECDEDLEEDVHMDGRLALQIIVRRDELLQGERSPEDDLQHESEAKVESKLQRKVYFDKSKKNHEEEYPETAAHAAGPERPETSLVSLGTKDPSSPAPDMKTLVNSGKPETSSDCRHTAKDQNSSVSDMKTGADTGKPETSLDSQPAEKSENIPVSDTKTGADSGKPETSLDSQHAEKGKNSSVSQTGGDEETFVKPRSFKCNEKSCTYNDGVLDVIETADGMIIPSVELKYHNSIDPKEKKAKTAFLRKSLKFVCGCLNSRKNGTIYFGVAEHDQKNQKYPHGKIVGLELSNALKTEYYEVFRTYLEKCFEKQKEIVREIVWGPYFVLKRGTAPRRYVIEIDVEPRSDFCKEVIFVLDPRSIYEDFCELTKQEKKKDRTGVCVRRMEAGKVSTADLGPQERREFERDIFPRLLNLRQDEENQSKLRRERKITSEAEKLKTFLSGFDESLRPILVVSEPTKNVKEAISDNLNFVKHIQWAAVFDHDYNSDSDGLYNFYKGSFVPIDVTEVTVGDFSYMTVDQYRKKLSFPENTAWFFCNGKSTGENAFSKLEKKDWKRRYFPLVKNAVSFFQDPTVIQPTRHFVIILVSTAMTEDIIETADEFVSMSNIGWESVIFVFDCDHTQSVFCQHLSEDVLEHSAVLPWRDVQAVVNKILDFEKRDDSKEVPSASKAPVKIPPNQWQTWGDLCVLSALECDEIDVSDGRWQKKADEAELHFYNGGQVAWINFFIHGHVMPRCDLSNIKRQIYLTAELSDSKDSVPKLVIGHMPGTGGTTLGKHLLWELKAEFKCAVVEQISQETERQICEFWEAKECLDRANLNPVILLIDNVTSDESKTSEVELCQRLFRRQKKYQLSKPLAIVIICRRSVTKLKEFNLFLTQTITEQKERNWLEKKCQELESKKIHPEIKTFLGILSMRHDFDKQYLQDIILPYLNHSGLLENERKLITYIALLTVYFPTSKGSPGIPVESCEKLLETAIPGNSLVRKACRWEKSMSSTAEVLLVRENKKFTRKKVVRLANQACAEAVLNAVKSVDHLNLADIVIECLNSRFVASLELSEATASSFTRNVCQSMLIERRRSPSGNISPMSPLIVDIHGQCGFERAVEVLELGFEKLGGEAFYQQLARFYRNESSFDEAKRCAKVAVDLAPDVSDYKHTLGTVYLGKFKKLEAHENHFEFETHIDNVKIAIKALACFRDAQRGEDAINISYAFVDTIQSVNLILEYMINNVIWTTDYYRFGRYLMEEQYSIDYIDSDKDLKNALKSLLEEGRNALKFTYHLAFSYKGTGQRDSVKTARSENALSVTKERCVKHFRAFARNIRTVVRPITDAQYASAEAYRIENLKLTGSFFESIMYQVYLYHFPGQRSRQRNEKNCIETLKDIRNNLQQILQLGTQVSTDDMDNFVTVCLALELLGQETDFSTNQQQIYRFCNKIIQIDTEVMRVTRAHLYRVLSCWPTREPCPEINGEHFRTSFYHKPTYLQSNTGPLIPQVHFFVARRKSRFHLCHWTDIFNKDGESENRTVPIVMHQKLQEFSGNYKVIEEEGKRPAYRLEFSMRAFTDVLPDNLMIRTMRGLEVYMDGRVKFYLGFSLQGPIAYIFDFET